MQVLLWLATPDVIWWIDSVNYPPEEKEKQKSRATQRKITAEKASTEA